VDEVEDQQQVPWVALVFNCREHAGNEESLVQFVQEVLSVAGDLLVNLVGSISSFEVVLRNMQVGGGNCCQHLGDKILGVEALNLLDFQPFCDDKVSKNIEALEDAVDVPGLLEHFENDVGQKRKESVDDLLLFYLLQQIKYERNQDNLDNMHGSNSLLFLL